MQPSALSPQHPDSGAVRLGYACLCLSLDVRYTRGTILKYAQPERLRALIRGKLQALAPVLEFNRQIGVRVFRLSSDLIPFGGHPVNQIRWWEELGPAFDELGRIIREAGLRVSVHPGQYTVLSAVRSEVVEAAMADLVYHARLLDALGTDASHKIVIHGGGVYGDKAAATARWVERFRRLPEAVQRRLIVENDERLFGVEDVLEISHRSGAPVVFDAFHHRVMSGRADDYRRWLEAAFGTWQAGDGPPKIHFSSQAPGLRPGAHARLVDPDEFADFLAQAPPRPFDCMLEAKDKDKALLLLRDQLAERQVLRSVA